MFAQKIPKVKQRFHKKELAKGLGRSILLDISGVRVLDRFILMDGRYAELIEAWKIKVKQVSSLESISLEGVTVNIDGDSVTFLLKDSINNSTLKIVCDVFEAPVEVSVESVNLQLSEK